MTQKNDVQLVKDENVVKEVATTPVVEPPKPVEEPQRGGSKFPKRINDGYRIIRSSIEVSIIDAAISDMAARYGFNSGKLNEGKLALENYEQAADHLRDCEAGIVAKNKAFNDLFAIVNEKLAGLMMKSKIAFKLRPEIQKSLGLQAAKSKSFGQWDVWAAMFIEKLSSNSECLEELKNFDTTRETLDTLKRQREELAVLFNAKKIALAEMRLACKQKQENFKKLKAWYMEFRKAMRFAFKNDPAQLIKIGITVKSRR